MFRDQAIPSLTLNLLHRPKVELFNNQIVLLDELLFFFPCYKISTNNIILFVHIVFLIPDYDSDDEPPCLPGGNSDSDSEDEEKNGRPAAKSSRPGVC